MNTWLLLYPSTKAHVPLQFYTLIVLNIQFLNVDFTEPANREHSNCALKRKHNSSGPKEFLTMLVLPPTPSPKLVKLSAAPYDLKAARTTAPDQPPKGNKTQRRDGGMRTKSCVRTSGMTKRTLYAGRS